MYQNYDSIDDTFTGQVGETELIHQTEKSNEVVYVSYKPKLVKNIQYRVGLLANILD